MDASSPPMRPNRRRQTSGRRSSPIGAEHEFLPAEKTRALVVRNATSSLPSLTTALEELGLAVCEAERGVEAVTLARNWAPDIVLLDTQLQDAPGREVAAWLRSHPAMRTTPIVLLTDQAHAAADHHAGSDFVLIDRTSSTPDLRISIRQLLLHQHSHGVAP